MLINKLFSKVYLNISKLFPSNINLFLAKVFKKLHNLSIKSSFSRDFLANINIENCNFKIWLMKNDDQAHSVYRPLHDKKISYETIMIKSLVSTIEKLKAKNFLDLGSFMGYYACFIAKYFDDKIKVYAIESNEEYSRYIDKSVKINNFENVEILNEILSDKNEDLYVHKEGVYNLDEKKTHYQKKLSVTLDEICLRHKINPEIIKVDVHGAEGKVLFGSKKILQNNTKIILLELHTSKYLKKFSNGCSRKKIIEYLLSLDFKCYLISSFRDFEQSVDLQKSFQIRKKFNYIQINLENFDSIFFDRDQKDQFIFGCKNNIDIQSFEYF